MINNPDELKLAYTAIEEELAFSGDDTRRDAWIKAFTERINDLILNDFNKLISALYRLDISESRLRALLKEKTPGDTAGTAEVICGLILERQIEKIRSKKQFRRDENISDDEKW